MTSHFDCEQLFRGESNGCKLSIKELGGKIIEFINLADPNKHVTVHYLRKVASSLNFFQYMEFNSLTKYTGWKSPKVFFRHYLANIEAISLPVVAAGRVVLPDLPV